MGRKPSTIAALDAISPDYRSLALSGFKTDFQIFEAWCKERNCKTLPATLTTVALFLEDQAGREDVTVVKRQLCAIVFVHSAAKHALPTWGKKIQDSIRFAELSTAFRLNFQTRLSDEEF